MKKLIDFYQKHAVAIMVAFAILVLVNLFLALQVGVNYDLAKYLPEDSKTKQAIQVLDQNFGYPGTAQILIEDVSLIEAQQIKNEIAAISGVANVVWLDDMVDIRQPLDFIDSSLLNDYYLDGNALFLVEFTENDYSVGTGMAIIEIRGLLGEDAPIIGAAEDSRFMRSVLNTEMGRIVLVVVPLCILILMLAGRSWIEPVPYLIIIGVAIALNMGTNLIFGEISFITQGICAVLQLAISLDYSLFLMHRYLEERDKGEDLLNALQTAMKGSFSSISASAMTTIAGFMALVFMQYKIGQDIGFVLAKGIVFSFFCTITLLPVLIISFHKIIDKTRHKPFIPKFKGVGKWTVRLRWPIFAFLLLLLVPAYLAQSNNNFLYGDSSGSAEAGAMQEQRTAISSQFGYFSPVMILIPNDDVAKETEFAAALGELEYVRSVQGLTTVADPTIPREFLPATVRDQFLSGKYSRIIAYLNIGNEGPLTFSAAQEIEALAEEYYPDQWLMAGNTTSVNDIKETVVSDSVVVAIFSIVAVALIIMVTFRSLSIPVVLVFVIQSSIWINMSIPYFTDFSPAFIGYLITSSLQLGATIDYAILIGNRYMEFRQSHPPQKAALEAMDTAGGSVMTSALILTVAGFGEGLLSQISSISQIGVLIGRGAALSGLMVIFVLPPLLVICDKAIMKTTRKPRCKKKEELNL